MGSTQERIQKRREYVWKKAGGYVLLPVGFVLVALCVRAMLGPHRPLFAVLLAGLYGGSIGYLMYCVRKAVQVSKIPYVPPVTSDTLPAEEVLVRGSDEPAQEQSKVLLRGTQGGQGIAEQELLRGSQGQE